MDNVIHRVSEAELTAPKFPKVTPDDIRNYIVGETYTLLPNGRTTICQLTLQNGFTVEGKSACVHKDNYNEELGNKIAREMAIEEIWPLLGFDLATKLKLVEAGTEPSLPSMKTYVGMKVVHAEAMTREAYNVLRGWQLPADEDGSDEGYIVEYADGIGVPNHKGFNGYISWSPKDVFEGSYKEL